MLEFSISVFFVVVISVVYTEVLTAPGMLLDFWCRFLHNKIKKEWILKPLIDCVYCFGGQLALWSGFFIWNDYKLLTHFLFIVTVLFTIHIYKLIWN
jgi:hypothetical protein